MDDVRRVGHMVRPGNIGDIEDVKLWIADHDARIDELWRQQHERNIRHEAKLEGLTMRLTAVEKRIMLLAGMASALGGALGTIITSVINA